MIEKSLYKWVIRLARANLDSLVVELLEATEEYLFLKKRRLGLYNGKVLSHSDGEHFYWKDTYKENKSEKALTEKEWRAGKQRRKRWAIIVLWDENLMYFVLGAAKVPRALVRMVQCW